MHAIVNKIFQLHLINYSEYKILLAIIGSPHIN